MFGIRHLAAQRAFKSRQETFETGDRDEVEEFLSTTASNWTWLPGDALRVTQDRPATLRHPVTGEEVWFNQSDQWHPAALGEDAAALARVLPADEPPQSISFADGGHRRAPERPPRSRRATHPASTGPKETHVHRDPRSRGGPVRRRRTTLAGPDRPRAP
ncbi:hypothetical protein AB0H77_25635 [Streptomyces sp. NPDC050844]|uniref:hypothetical protein n=1 Tax=Streptomyces sp. NPDC050844 TaxID=3155790 RepID=UPI0033F8963F